MNQSMYQPVKEKELQRKTRFGDRRQNFKPYNPDEESKKDKQVSTNQKQELEKSSITEKKALDKSQNQQKNEERIQKIAEKINKMNTLQGLIRQEIFQDGFNSRKQSVNSNNNLENSAQNKFQKSQSMRKQRNQIRADQLNIHMLRSQMIPKLKSNIDENGKNLEGLSDHLSSNGGQQRDDELTKEQHDIDMENYFKGIQIQEKVIPMEKQIDRSLYNKKRYVPMALTLESECEYHDVFKQILLSLFDMLRVLPEKQSVGGNKQKYDDAIIQSRKLAFADLVAHIAFMKTIPAPPFNSIYNIQMLPVIQDNYILKNQLNTFIIKEGAFESLPNHNQNPIKVLFEILDVHSILQCWKALIFEKWLVLVSSQVSLQFLVAEGLKQLMFPLTWRHRQIIPGNESFLEYLEFQPLIFGSQSSEMGFEYFDGLREDLLVCDIDGSFTSYTPSIGKNDEKVPLPKFPNENMYIRILNQLKNTKLTTYDKAYPLSHQHGGNGGIKQNQGTDSRAQQEATEEFVKLVRETFFTIIKPFLSHVEDYIDKNVKSQEAVFTSYFKSNEYVGHFEDICIYHKQFAEALLPSSTFQHFCDDYFKGTLACNYQMFRSILEARGEINPSHDDFQQWDADLRGETFQNLEQVIGKKTPLHTGKAGLPPQPRWPEDKPVVFNFRMPSDYQKAMLFERIQFKIEKTLKNKEKKDSNEGQRRDTAISEFIIKNGELRYNELIGDIRKAYLSPDAKKKADLNISILSDPNKQLRINQHIQKVADSSEHRENANIKHPNNQVLPDPQDNQKEKLRQEDEKGKIEIQINEADEEILQNLTPQRPILQKQLTTQPPSSSKMIFPGGIMDESIVIETSVVNGGKNSDRQYFIEQEYQRVRMCDKKISRLMYGRNGMISFMHHLFGMFEEYAMKETVNYYFAMKQQISEMESYENVHYQARKERYRNMQIKEEDEQMFEEEKEMQGKSHMKFSTDEPIVLESSSESEKYQQIMSFSQFSAVTAAIYKQETDWIAIKNWYNASDSLMCQKLRRSHQYVTFKTKLIEEFEKADDQYAIMWHELFKKYPLEQPRAFKLFPQAIFFYTWDNLSSIQQNHWFAHYGQRAKKTPQALMITKIFYKPSKTSININDEAQIRQSTINKTWSDKKKEEVERQHKLKQQQETLKQHVQPSFNPQDTQGKNNSDGRISHDDLLNDNPISKKIKEKNEAQKKKSSSGDGWFTRLFKRGSFSKDNKNKTKETPQPDKSPKATGPKEEEFKVIHHQQPFHHSHTQNEVPMKSNQLLNQKPPARHESYNHIDRSQSNFDVMTTPQRIRSTQESDTESSQYLLMTDADRIAQHLVEKIKKFWDKHAKDIESKQYRFKEEALQPIIEELQKYQKYFEQLKFKIYCHPSQQEIEECKRNYKEVKDIQKMSFLLNIFNFLVLYELAILFISSPQGVRALCKYSMWHYFLSQASINLGGYKISAFWIAQKGLNLPGLCSGDNLAHFLIEEKKICQQALGSAISTAESEADKYLKNFILRKPDPLVAFGLYLPLKNWPYLTKFNSNEISKQLRHLAGTFISSKIEIKEDFNVVILPKCIQWYKQSLLIRRDKNQEIQESEDIQLLRGLNKLAFSDGHSKNRPSPISPLLNRIDGKKDNETQIIQVLYRPFTWELRVSNLHQLMHRSSHDRLLETKGVSE